MSELAAGLAATSNEPVADSPATPDSVLDAAFESPSEPAASSEPSGDPPPANEPAAATAQPPATEHPNGAKGEPPRERWDTILANARTKAREEALAEHRDHLEVVAELKRDFPGTLARLLEEGAIDPRFSDALTTKAAAILSARRQQAKADTEPEPDLQTADGALVYSADQLRKWHQWNQTKTTQQLSEQFKPLQELQHLFEQHKQTTQDAQKAAAIAEKRGGIWKEMPLFKENSTAILERQAALYAEMKAAPDFDPVDGPWTALQKAYAEVVTQQALPKLQTQQTDSLVAQAARKRAASSSDPAASLPAQPRKPRTVDEALDQVFSSVT